MNANKGSPNTPEVDSFTCLRMSLNDYIEIPIGDN